MRDREWRAGLTASECLPLYVRVKRAEERRREGEQGGKEREEQKGRQETSHARRRAAAPVLKHTRKRG